MLAPTDIIEIASWAIAAFAGWYVLIKCVIENEREKEKKKKENQKWEFSK